MKKIVTISMMFVLSLSASAQKLQTEEDIAKWVQQEMNAARESFRIDSIDYMDRRTRKLNEKIESIKEKAEKLKKKIEKKNHSTKEAEAKQDGTEVTGSNVVEKPNTTAPIPNIELQPADSTHDENSANPPAPEQEIAVEKSPSEVSSKSKAVKSLKKGCKEFLKRLTGEDEMNITRKFLHDFMAMYDDVSQYRQIKEDLVEIDRLLVERNQKMTELESFIRDLQTVSFADSVLTSPYDKANRVEAQEKMKNVKFLTDKQRNCALVDSLRHGLDIYFLSTTNMLDLITEITECHEKYIASETDAERTAVSKELTNSIEFDARVKNFRSVKYMSDMYDKIISEILCYDDHDEFVFQEFNIDALKEIKKSLEAMRQKK